MNSKKINGAEKMNDGIGVLFIIGLSAAGKTTLAKLSAERLREFNIPCVIVDGNEVRDLFEKKLGYDKISRQKQTMRIKNITKWIARNGVLPIVSIIHPFEDDRMKCREELDGYYEVYLDCDLKTCAFRDNKKLYAPAMAGKKKHVIGLDIPFDQPQHSDLILDSSNLNPEELWGNLWKVIQPKLGNFKN